MSDQVKEKDKALLELTQEHFKDQITAGEQNVNNALQQIEVLKNHVQQQTGIVNYAKFILATYDLPKKKEEPAKKEKTDLEVK